MFTVATQEDNTMRDYLDQDMVRIVCEDIRDGVLEDEEGSVTAWLNTFGYTVYPSVTEYGVGYTVSRLNMGRFTGIVHVCDIVTEDWDDIYAEHSA